MAHRAQSAAICQLADECYHKHLIAGYLPARPIHCFPCLQWKDTKDNAQGLYRQVLRNTQMVSTSPSDKTHCQFNSCQGHCVSLRTKQKQSSSRWEEVMLAHTSRKTSNYYMLYSHVCKTFVYQRKNKPHVNQTMPIIPTRDTTTRRRGLYLYQTEGEAHCPTSHFTHNTTTEWLKFMELQLGF